MKKSISIASTLAIITTTALYSQTININPKWQLLGAVNDINITKFFNKPCIDVVWKFNNNSQSWSAYSPKSYLQNVINSNSNIFSLSNVHKGYGFWVQANDSCTIDMNSSDSSNGNMDNTNATHENINVRAWFGDKENNRIDVVDVSNMKLLDEVPTGHKKTYAAEVIKLHGQETQRPKMYIDNRGSNAIDVLDSASNKIVKTIQLPFYPRSISVNKNTGLVAVSGVDKPMTAIIDSKTDTLIATVGNNNVTYPVTSGHTYVSSGTLACGHPEWLNDNHFVLLDRQNKQIKTYKIFKDIYGTWQTTLVNTIQTPSPVHNLIPPKIHGQIGHIIDKNSSINRTNHNESQYTTIFYATAEGATDVYPSVLKLEFNETTGLSIIDNLEIKKAGLSPNIMGVHHLNFMKNQKYIYVGSDEGNLFIVNYSVSPMKVEKIIPAGKGAGHTDEFKKGNIAVVINHKDKFITLMNTMTNTKIADINVSQIDDSLVGKVQTQSHPQYHFSPDGQYFYLFLTEEGALVKVSLTEKKVVERLDIGGKIAMGSFIGH